MFCYKEKPEAKVCEPCGRWIFYSFIYCLFVSMIRWWFCLKQVNRLDREKNLNKGWHSTEPWSTSIVFRYLSYSTMFAEYAVHHLWRCLAFGWAGTCLFLSFNLKRLVSGDPNGWRDDHGPTNVKAMVKIKPSYW